MQLESGADVLRFTVNDDCQLVGGQWTRHRDELRLSQHRKCLIGGECESVSTWLHSTVGETFYSLRSLLCLASSYHRKIGSLHLEQTGGHCHVVSGPHHR